MAGTIYLSMARKIARFAARNAGDPTDYPTFMVDYAIQRAGNELIRKAGLSLRVDTLPGPHPPASFLSSATTDWERKISAPPPMT